MRKRMDLGKTDLVRQISDELGSIKGRRRLEVVHEVLTLAEKLQDKAIIEGAKAIYTLNGRLDVDMVKGRKVVINYNKGSEEVRYAPPKQRINFKPGKRIINLNKAFKIMSYEEYKAKVKKGEANEENKES